jgi:allantoinase
MPVLARRRLPLLVHAELPARLAEPRDGSYAAYLASRPPDAEVDAIRLMAALARALDAQVHIVHVASAQAVGAVAAAKASGIRMSAETCPHYLTFAAGDIPAGATELKCAPPIRDASHRAALWDGLERGVLDLVASDHSPAPPAMKCRGDFRRAWGGIASLELASRAVWTGLAAREPRTDAALVQFARWMSEAPAKLAGLSTRKGRIAAGCDADLFIWDPDVESLVDAPRLQQRHKLTPYDGAVLRGTVGATFVRGRLVWDGTRAASRGGELV